MSTNSQIELDTVNIHQGKTVPATMVGEYSITWADVYERWLKSSWTNIEILELIMVLPNWLEKVTWKGQAASFMLQSETGIELFCDTNIS